jgi:hypothetical protein
MSQNQKKRFKAHLSPKNMVSLTTNHRQGENCVERTKSGKNQILWQRIQNINTKINLTRRFSLPKRHFLKFFFEN